jgi:peptidyl-prolyl cis-trans isomerase C
MDDCRYNSLYGSMPAHVSGHGDLFELTLEDGSVMRKRGRKFLLILPCALLITIFFAHSLNAAKNMKTEGETGNPPEGSTSPVENEPAARVNGVEISMQLLQKSFERQLEERGIDIRKIENRERYNELQREVLDVLIDQELLWQEAQEKGIIAKDEEVEMAIAAVTRGLPFQEAFAAILEEGGFTEESYREFVRAQISVSRLIETGFAPGISVSDSEVHDYYAENPDLFTRPEEVRARHILVKVEKSAGDVARKEAKRKIEQILKEAKGGADFSELAKKHSEGPAGPRGGDLGFFGHGKMAKPFEEAAFALKPGEISGVVETRFGYHVIKVEEQRGGDPVPEEEVSEKIRRNLTRRKIREAVQKRVKELREKATIEIFIPR